MKVYNPKDWFNTLKYLTKSEHSKKVYPILVVVALFSWGVAYVELEYLKLSDKSWIKNITTVHNLLGFVLSLILVFRTNTAYDRWWRSEERRVVKVCRCG